jgi:hypothetical protein
MITPPFRAYAQPSPEDVIASFKRAGLEAEKPAKMRPKDYGMAPYVCTGLRFLIPSLGADSGGRVFACPNDADRDAIAHYYQDLGRRSAAFFSWVFVKGNVVVQINGDLDDQTSEKYREAIP